MRFYEISEIKVHCNYVALYRVVKKFLDEQKVNLFTHPLQENKTLKVVIKRLLSDISEQELEMELKSLSYEVLHVRQFENATHKFSIQWLL